MRTSALLLIATLAATPAHAAPADTTAVGRLRADAAALRPLFRTPLVREFLAATARLPHVSPRTVWRDSARTNAWSETQARALPEDARAKLLPRALDESYYWNTRYGSPLAYARALEILGDHGVRTARGWRVADFGCGTLGALRLLASGGADATGIDVDPVLRALYSEPGDQGAVGDGRVRLVTGFWPGSDSVAREVGGGYDLFLSKNTLKRGYIHPAETVDPRMLVHLGVDDSAFVAAVWTMLKPGGRALIYNLSPAPAPPGKPYIPWADGRCAFDREVWERRGFRVVAFDADDGAAARAMGHALGWDAGPQPMDLARDLFAHWSLFEKPAR